MSLSELFFDVPHKWANLRVNDLVVDGEYRGPGAKESLVITTTYGGDLWNSPVTNRDITFYKTGNVVVMRMDSGRGAASGTGSTITIADKVPEEFMPYIRSELGGGEWCSSVPGYTANGYMLAHIDINETRDINIIFDEMPTGVNCGIDNLSFTWLTSLD